MVLISISGFAPAGYSYRYYAIVSTQTISTKLKFNVEQNFLLDIRPTDEITIKVFQDPWLGCDKYIGLARLDGLSFLNLEHGIRREESYRLVNGLNVVGSIRIALTMLASPYYPNTCVLKIKRPIRRNSILI